MDMKRTLGRFEAVPGRLVFPLSLNEPDSKFDDSQDKVKWKAGLRMEGEDATTMRALIEEVWSGWLGTVQAGMGKKPKISAKNIQWYTSDTKRWADMGESATRILDEIQPGELIIKTSCRAFQNGEPRRPVFFDAGGAGIKPENLPPIGFGTTAKLTGTFYGWASTSTTSLSLILNAIQLIDVIEPGRASQEAEDYGFKPTEGYKSDADKFIESLSTDDKSGDF